MKKIVFILSLLAFLIILAGWTPLRVEDDPLVRMPGTQPSQGVVLQGPGMELPNGCLNCHGEGPTDDFGNVVAPGYTWSGSMMAQAARDPIFWATLVVAAQDSIWKLGNPNAVDICLRCHFPEGWLAGRSGSTDDTGLELNAHAMTGSDFDGVHCDACHRMWDPHFESLHAGTREGDDWAGYWDEAEQTAPGSQWLADVTLSENRGLALGVATFSGASFFQAGMPPAEYNENGGGQFFVSADNINGNFEEAAKKRAGFADTVSDHSVLYSRYHKSKFFCSTCHDVSNPVLANVGHETDAPLPTEASSAHSYGHVERTFSEFMLSSYAQQGGAPTNAAFQAQGASTITWAAKCQDCHMADVTGKGCEETAAPLRPDDSAEHPSSGAPLHNFQGGNVWITEILASIDDHFSERYDPINLALLDQGPAALTLDLTQGIDLKDTGDSLAAASDRAREQLELAATVKNVYYDPVTGNLSFQVQNNTGHKLLSGYPEGRRMFVNIRAYDDSDSLLYEVNPYAYTLDVDGKGGTLKGLSDHADLSPALGADEAYLEELVYEVKPGSDFTGEEKTFHFALATNRYKDNRIPPKGFDIGNAACRLIQPVWDGVESPGYFTAEEYQGGYDRADLDGVLPTNAARVEVRLYYQGTSREYVQFLREEINGTAATLTNPPPSGEATSYIIQTDPFFDQLREWGDTMWSLWKHNHGFDLEAGDVPDALSGEVFPIAGGAAVDGIVPVEMAGAVWPTDVGDTVTITKATYDPVTTKLKIQAYSSLMTAVDLTAEALYGNEVQPLGPVPSNSDQEVFRLRAEPTAVRVTSSGGGSAMANLGGSATDTVTITKATYDPATTKLKIQAFTNFPYTLVDLTASAVYGTTPVALGPVPSNSDQEVFRLNVMPTAVQVTSSAGGSDQVALGGLDTVTITKATYDPATTKLKIQAYTNFPYESVTLTAEAITGGVPTILGTVPSDSDQQVFRLPAKPDEVRVTSTGGGSTTVAVP